MTVSVLMPCYNVEQYVRDAVISAIHQTWPIQDVICIDDGSTDATLKVLKALKYEYCDRLTVCSGPNKGGNHARNLGLSFAKTEYVQFLDADDVLDADKIAHQISLIESEKDEVDLVVGSLRVGVSPEDCEVRKPGSASDLVNLARTDLGRTSSNLWRTSALRDVGGWNENWPSSQEYELMFRLLKNHATVLYDHAPKTWVRKRPDSLTANDDVPRYRRIVTLRADILKYARSIGASDEDIHELEQSLFMTIRFLSFRSLPAALRMHDNHMPPDFAPDPKKFAPLYCTAYRALGYKITERIRRGTKLALSSLSRFRLS